MKRKIKEIAAALAAALLICSGCEKAPPAGAVTAPAAQAAQVED